MICLKSVPSILTIGRAGKQAFSFMLPPNFDTSIFSEFSSVIVVTEALMSTTFPITPDLTMNTSCEKAGQ